MHLEVPPADQGAGKHAGPNDQPLLQRSRTAPFGPLEIEKGCMRGQYGGLIALCGIQPTESGQHAVDHVPRGRGSRFAQGMFGRRRDAVHGLVDVFDAKHDMAGDGDGIYGRRRVVKGGREEGHRV